MEIIKEVRKEFQKMKQEIIDGTDISLLQYKFVYISFDKMSNVKIFLFIRNILYFQLSEQN